VSLKRFFRRGAWDEERARELEAYLAIETDENIAGMLSQQTLPIVRLRSAKLMESVHDWTLAAGYPSASSGTSTSSLSGERTTHHGVGARPSQ